MIEVITTDCKDGVAQGALDASMRAHKRVLTHYNATDGTVLEKYRLSRNIFESWDEGPAWLRNLNDPTNIVLLLYAFNDEKWCGAVEEACDRFDKVCVKCRIDIDGEIEDQARMVSESLFAASIPSMWLNIVGTRESECPGIQLVTEKILTNVFLWDNKTYSNLNWYFSQLTNKLDGYLTVSSERRYVIPYILRKVSDRFFEEFTCWNYFAKQEWRTKVRPHRGGEYHKGILTCDGYGINIEVIVDENERLIGWKVEVSKSWTTDSDDCRVGSDHKRMETVRRDLKEDEKQRLQELLDECTVSRAPAIVHSLLSKPLLLADGTVVSIFGDVLSFVCKGSGFWRTKLNTLFEFVEWSYSYLECFLSKDFVATNFPELSIPHRCSWFMSVVRLIDARRHYLYATLLRDYFERLQKVKRFYYSYYGAQPQGDCFAYTGYSESKVVKKFRGELESHYGVKYIAEE